MKDRHRASIVGLTSFGKGSVQTVIPLHNGADGALKLTTDRYYTPSGGSIQKTGIAPDLFAAESKRQAEGVYDTALQYTEATFHNALDAQEGKTRFLPTSIEIPNAPAGLQKVSMKNGPAGGDEDDPPVAKSTGKPDDADDFQLQRALAVLRYGSVAAAEQASPTGVYARPTPKFLTAQVSAKTPMPGAASQIAKTKASSDTAPPGQIAPSAPALSPHP